LGSRGKAKQRGAIWRLTLDTASQNSGCARVIAAGHNSFQYSVKVFAGWRRLWQLLALGRSSNQQAVLRHASGNKPRHRSVEGTGDSEFSLAVMASSARKSGMMVRVELKLKGSPMRVFTVSEQLEVEIERNRCRVNKVMRHKTKTRGEWIQLPVDESQLSLSNSPARDLAIAVAAYEMGGGGSDLRDVLTIKPK